MNTKLVSSYVMSIGGLFVALYVGINIGVYINDKIDEKRNSR